MDESLRSLPLREYRPRSMLRTARHDVVRSRFPAVDAHNHLGRWLSDTGDWVVPDVDELLATLAARNVAAIVNFDGRWGDELEANLDRYDRAHPGFFATFCQLDWAEAVRPGFARRLVESLHRSAKAGAKGLKVWKDLGLHIRDDRDRLLLPDDPRLTDVWDAAGDFGFPVAIHTADPVAFFEPPDATNERLEELLVHPDLSFADPDRFPRFERLIDALESVISSHPRTIFIGVHVGNCAEDLERVQRMLERYPNYHIDIGARIAELGRQPRASARLLQRHADRVLFGTDDFPPDPSVYAIYFRFLETEDEYIPYSTEEVPPEGRWAISGLGLSDVVLGRVYASNARRLIPGLA
jgi:predicted TIM-barrel fold metal-dependent hydrolase